MDSTTISKAKPAYKSMDYHFLREAGLRHIQDLAGSLWTDYNSHDPGITLLEILCYAITDLGYRTNRPVADLLAGQTQANGKDFYDITEVLPCNPVTITDLRKLIIDHPGIRNAWIEKNETITFNGLYDVMLELEEDDTLGDLNLNVFSTTLEDVNVNGIIEDYDIEVAFDFQDDLSGVEENQDITSVSIVEEETESGGTEALFVRIQNEGILRENANDYYTELVLTLANGRSYTIIARIKVMAEVSNDILDLVGIGSLQQAIRDELTDIMTPEGLVNTYWSKINATIGKVNEVKQLLHNHRSLCEDFYSFRAFRLQQISIRADVDLGPNAKPDEVLAGIYYRIHAFLSPEPRFYTLEELLEKGRSVEHIFKGPLLRHGFLDTEELEAIQRRGTIYASDLLQLLEDIPGLIAIRDLRISNYYNNEVLEQDTSNCLKLALPDRYNPQLSPEKSRISFYKDRLPVTVAGDAALERFEVLKSQNRQEKQPAVYDLSPPQGEDPEAANYFSIQHHFPPVYGMGSEQLPDSVSDLRKAQARQFKGYLLFFEQLLANYLAQLANIKSLFSMEASVNSTYFSQSVFESAPGADELLSKEGEEPPGAQYMENLPGMMESSGLFYERRNRFLDHLMARFNESFSDYALFLYATTADEAAADESLIADKIAFLQEYPTLSRDRARAFNYLAQRPGEIDPEVLVPDVWNTANVSGLKKRISRKLGLENYNRENIFDFLTIAGDAPSFGFMLDYEECILENPEDFPDEDNALNAAHQAAILAAKEENYQLTGDAELGFSFQLIDEQGGIIASVTSPFEFEEDRVACIQHIIRFMNTRLSFHIMEHSLLHSGPVKAISNLEVWLKADEGVEAFNGADAEVNDDVMNWIDQANGRVFTQADDTRRPILTTAGGYPVIRFTAANTNELIYSKDFIGQGDFTYFVVASTNTDSGALTGTGYADLYLDSNNITGRVWSDSDPLVEVTHSEAVTQSELFIASISWRDDLVTLSYNGIEESTVVTQGTGGRISHFVGGNPENITFFDGDIAEVIVYSRFLTDEEHQLVEDYLSVEYGISIPDGPPAIPPPDPPPINLQIPSNENSVYLTDPYSFRISFILPEVHPKLGHPDFKPYTERVIRSETPAHIVPYIHWVNPLKLQEFETAYEDWLEEQANPESNAAQLAIVRDHLVMIMNSIFNRV